METVFDHSPTGQELTELFGVALSQAEYLPADEATENGRLYRLFARRGDADKAAGYLARIADPDYRRDAALLDVL